MKPAHEPVVLAWKPAKRATEFPGLESCMVAHASEADRAESEDKNRHSDFGSGPRQHNGVYAGQPAADRAQYDGSAGRWPPNIVLTHRPECREIGVRKVRSVSYRANGTIRAARVNVAKGAERERVERGQRGIGDPDGLETIEAWECVPGCPVAELDRQSGITTSSGGSGPASLRSRGGLYDGKLYQDVPGAHLGGLGDTGGASRFFPVFHYQAKAPTSERPRLADGTAWSTVKPLGFMRWAVRLITPQGGTCLDPFAGTFTTAEACIVEGFPCIAIDKSETAIRLGMERLSKPIQPCLFDLAPDEPAA